MTLTRTNAIVLAAMLALGSATMAACSSSSPSAETTVASEAPTTEAPTDATEGTSYCDPLAAAYEIKPVSGEPATDAELAAFGEAMVPVADAAAADGRQDLADMFTLVAQVNSDPNNTTDAQTSEALNEVIANADEVNAACGIDLLQ